MNRITVESTTLATVAYDGARQRLQVEFRSRAIYEYIGVPAAVHAALLGAPSKGQYFNRVIRGRFAYAPVARLPEGVRWESLGSGGRRWHVQ